jgi:predicted nucleic acid-binding protein
VNLLADTSALLALVLRDERSHAAAAAFVRSGSRLRFVVTELIIAELATRLRVRAGVEIAVRVATDVVRSGRYQVVYVDEPLILGALARMTRFADKRLSLTDCTSFEVMERLGLEAAFTFDRDFRDCGFRVVP